jgi:hypothetical protein
MCALAAVVCVSTRIRCWRACQHVPLHVRRALPLRCHVLCALSADDRNPLNQAPDVMQKLQQATVA